MRNNSPLKPLFISIKDAAALIGLSTDSIRRLEKNGKFPKRVSLSDKRYGYYYENVEAWANEKNTDRTPPTT